MVLFLSRKITAEPRIKIQMFVGNSPIIQRILNKCNNYDGNFFWGKMVTF